MGGGYASLVRLNFTGSKIDRVGSGLCFVAVVKKPLYDDPVKGWNH
jgi:hypothetical protein